MPEEPERVRVLWVSKGLGPGGMEHLLLTHARSGDRDHISYSAAHVIDRPNAIIDDLESAGVRCHRLGTGDPKNPIWLRDLRSLVRQQRIDVVHVHSPFVAALARPALRALRARPAVVYTEHNSLSCYGRGTRFADLLTYPLDDVRYAVSSAARDSVPAWLGSRTEVLTHGVDVAAIAKQRPFRDAARSQLGLSAGESLVGIVANLRAAKAYPVLLEAASIVVEKDPSVKFVSMGQGPLADELALLRDNLGLGDSFRFLGFTADPTRLMAGFDVLALSSDVEGMPVCVMEAKALGLPVVATAVGGLPEMVNDHVDGVLVPRGDAAALAAALLEVVGNGSLRASMGEASAADSERFRSDSAVLSQDRRYRELASLRR